MKPPRLRILSPNGSYREFGNHRDCAADNCTRLEENIRIF